MRKAEPVVSGYRHQAVFYAGEGEFVSRIGGFIRDGARLGEPTLVVVSAKKIERLRRKLGSAADKVQFADMAEVGANPGRIIPAWREFVDRHASGGRPLRGVGEPIFPERSSAELVECEGHEALLNAAFDDSVPFWLVCPYDTTALHPSVLRTAERNHPVLAKGNRILESLTYLGRQAEIVPFLGALPEPPVGAAAIPFGAGSLPGLRSLVAQRAARSGFSAGAVADYVFSVNEVATNSLRHGGGGGMLRIWNEGVALVSEVTDTGRFRPDFLVGRRRPVADIYAGRGLWLVNQLCDLVQLRTFETAVVIRLHMNRR
jgi:anti-sigma regulatory factor (Ser/Thr protein kinase)